MMLNHKLFFGYSGLEDFLESEHLASSGNFLRFLSMTSQDDVVKMYECEKKIIHILINNESPSFNNYDFILALFNKVSTHDKVAKVYSNLAREYHALALSRFVNCTREPEHVEPLYLNAVWFLPSNVLNEMQFIDEKSNILYQVMEGLCQYIHILITGDNSFDYTEQEREWFDLIKSVNLSYLKNGYYRRQFPVSLVSILDSIILETPQKSVNETVIRDLQWMRLTQRLDDEMFHMIYKYKMEGLRYSAIQYDILAIGRDPELYTMNPVDIVSEVLSNIPTRYLDSPKFGMFLVDTFKTIKDVMCDINTTEYAWMTKCKSLDACNAAIQQEKEKRLSGEYDGPDYDDIQPCCKSSACESVTPVYTQPIDYLDRWSFDYISGDDIEVAIESYDDDDESEIRRRNREKRDELNEKHRRQSEKIRATSAKIYRGYKTYKDNEEKVDSQLTSITKAIGEKAVGLETDKIRDEVIEGKKLTVIGTLKKALGTVAIFSVNKMAGLIAVVTHFYLHDKVTNKERKRVCLELEAEIEIVNEKIEDARADGNRKAKYDLMRTKNNLEVALRKIKAKADSSSKSAIGEAKSLVRRNQNS